METSNKPVAGLGNGQAATDPRLLQLSPLDTVLVARARIAAGEAIDIDGRRIRLAVDIGLGHKLARISMRTGERVLKYGAPIGVATAPIDVGDHVHVHNVRSDYTPTYHLEAAKDGGA